MQSRGASLVEALANVVVGYFVAVAANAIILPLYGAQLPTRANFEIGLAFTAISLARSYCLRRVFNRGVG